MQQRPERKIRLTKTAQILVEEDWQKRMAHGHWCPICKDQILDVSTCKVVYLVPKTPENVKSLSLKKLYSRYNRRVVCPDCVQMVREMTNDPSYCNRIKRELVDKVGTSSGRVKVIIAKKGDTYRDTVLKMNGIEPNTMPNFTVYAVEDKVGEAKGDVAIFLKVFNEALTGTVI